MKIEKINVTEFTYTSTTVHDTDGHTHPGDPHDSSQAMLTITDDEGNSGHSFGAAESLRAHVVDNYVKKVLMGEDPAVGYTIMRNMANVLSSRIRSTNMKLRNALSDILYY